MRPVLRKNRTPQEPMRRPARADVRDETTENWSSSDAMSVRKLVAC